jgi:hypothetical protein
MTELSEAMSEKDNAAPKWNLIVANSHEGTNHILQSRHIKEVLNLQFFLETIFIYPLCAYILDWTNIYDIYESLQNSEAKNSFYLSELVHIIW